MLDAARRMITPSARSDVPPFMVMDVMAAAARIEAAGGRVIHMEVGQPAAPAPASAIAAARAALASGRLRYTETLGIATLRARIARHYQESLRRLDRSGAHRRHHRIVGRIHPGLPRAVRARGSGRGRAAGLSALSPYPERARLRAGGDRDHAGDALGDHARHADGRASPGAAQGRAGRQPRQPDRHHDDRARRCAISSTPRKARGSGSSPTRSITASTTPSRPKPRRDCPTRL